MSCEAGRTKSAAAGVTAAFFSVLPVAENWLTRQRRSGVTDQRDHHIIWTVSLDDTAGDQHDPELSLIHPAPDEA